MADTERVVADFRALGNQPRHMGRMAEADGIGNVGSIVVGRALRVFVRIEDGRVADASFQVFACPEVVPAAVVVCDRVPGMELATAREWDEEDLCAAAGGLPLDELPLVSWPLVGLRLALADAVDEEPPVVEDRSIPALVCRCHGVTRETVAETIAELDDPTTEAVIEATAAGTGCGTCRRDVAAMVEEAAGAAAAPAVRTGGSGRVALLKRIAAAAEPYLAEADCAAGELELWNLRDNAVEIRCRGAMADPEHAERRRLLERLDRLLKDEVDPVLEVRPV